MIFAVVTLLSVVSIIGRRIGHPIQGDFELVQLACAVAIAFCLPYCQLQRGHIIVDFFTTRASQRARGTLDALGALLLALVMALMAWRTGVGALAMKASNETSMIMGLPVWCAYALMAPAFAVTALAALATALRDWRAR